MINEKDIPAKQTIEGKETWFSEKNVNKKRQKYDKCPQKKGKKEIDSLIKIEKTLKKGNQFRKVFRRGKTFRGVSFRAVYIENTLGFIRLGFSLSAKSGKAVQRNLIRRRIKGLANEKRRRIGADIVILPAGKLKNTKWHEIREEFEKLISIIEDDN